MMDFDYREIRVLASFATLVIFLLLEVVLPRRHLRLARANRWPLNFGLTLFNSMLLSLSKLTPYGVSLFCGKSGYGLLNFIEIHPIIKVIITFLLFDLFIYVQHIVFHRVSILWRLHEVHHSDLDLDASSAFRFHPLEIAISMMVKIALVFIVGADPVGILLFEIALNSGAIFSHSNIAIPNWIDRFLQFAVVTPNMHYIHHSVVQAETNTNFGFNLSIWDRIFKTLHTKNSEDQKKVVVGIAGIPNQTFLQLMLLPLRKK